ncbi:MAG: TonB-dependent receptor [Aestuariibacter sp.]
MLAQIDPKFRLNKIACTVVSAYFLSAVVAAQQDATSSAEIEEEAIENIVVYSQKRPQHLSDIAVTVSAFNGKFIEDRNLKDTTQLAALVPNVKFSNNAGEGTPPAFNIRGVGMIDYNTSTVSPIAVYSDDVVSGSANNLSANLFDLEQVEVLRGPQGTLFGRNTTGGAILLRSKMPGQELEGYVKGSLAEHRHRSLDAAVTIPVNEHFSNRIAYNFEDYNFSIHNLHPESPDGGLRQSNVRLISQYHKNDVSVMFKLQAENWQGAPKPIESAGILRNLATGELCAPNEAGDPDCFDSFGFSVPSDDYWDTIADTNDKRHDTDSWAASLKLVWEYSDNLAFTSITALRELDRFHSFDSDGPGNFIEGSFDTENDLMTQEFSVAYQNDDVYWVTGLYFLNEDILQENDLDLFRDFRSIPGLESIGAQFFYHNILENESSAIYSQIDYDFAEHYILTAGLRLTDEETTYRAIADLDTAAIFIPQLWDVSGKVDDRELSGKLSLVHTLSEDTSMYYSYSRGYKSGGYNGGFATSQALAEFAEYRPETLDAVEVGARLNLWDKKIRANFSTFYYDYNDRQVFINIGDDLTPVHVLKNAGSSSIFGLESEMWWYASGNTTFNLNIGYIPDADIGEFDDGVATVDSARTPFTSEWNIGANVFYERDFNSGVFTAELGFEYQSDFYFDQFENPYTEQTAYTLWHGRIAYSLNNNMELGLWGKNLFNEEYAELRFDSIAALNAVTELKGEKRQLGVEVTYSF